MPATPISTTVREVINGDVNVSADEIIRRVRAKGVTAPDQSIKDAVYNVKSDLRKKAAKKGPKAPKLVPAAARETKQPTLIANEVAPPVLVTASAPTLALDLRAVLANVALVNGAIGACAGVEPARKVAEAVQACGGVEAFLLHLDLIAQVRGATA